jgi:hypothetical protein
MRAGSINSAIGIGKPSRLFEQARRADRGDGSAPGRTRRWRARPRVVETTEQLDSMGNHRVSNHESRARLSRVAELGYVVVASKTRTLLVR